MRRYINYIICFVLSILLIFNTPLTVFASTDDPLDDGENDGYDRYMGGTNIEGYNSWEATDKKSLFANNILSFFASIGMYIKYGSGGSLLNIFTEHLIETNRIENSDDIDEYIAKHLTANDEETELYISNDLSNALYGSAQKYIEEETGWYNITTSGLSNIPMSCFTTLEQYTAFKKHLSDNPETIFFNVCSRSWYGYMNDDGKIVNGYEYHDDGTSKYYTWVSYFKPESEFYTALYKAYSGYSQYRMYPTIDWIVDSQHFICIDESGQVVTDLPYNVAYYFVCINDDGSTNFDYPYYSEGRKVFRAYKSLEDLKTYSVGSRPYYITDKFQDYDINGDNSCILSESDLQNSSVYGDVYNYIINNYDNPDGLTEQELIDILEKYFGDDSGSGGSGGGSGSGGSGGSGLSGFLDGLGSIGDAILSILGKLLEYVGKALDLLSGTVTKVIDLVPKNITNLLGGLFPFLPQEWLTAIELSLVLAVIIGIVGIFKK